MDWLKSSQYSSLVFLLVQSLLTNIRCMGLERSIRRRIEERLPYLHKIKQHSESCLFGKYICVVIMMYCGHVSRQYYSNLYSSTPPSIFGAELPALMSLRNPTISSSESRFVRH